MFPVGTRARGIPVKQLLLALRLCQQWQIREPLPGIGHHAFQECLQMPQHAADALMSKVCACIAHAHQHTGKGSHGHGEWIVCAFHYLHMFDLQATLLHERGISRIARKYKQVLEQGLATRHLAPGLHLHQGAVFVLASFYLLGLQLLQPGQ